MSNLEGGAADLAVALEEAMRAQAKLDAVAKA
jgi:hypothetical protein